ncbi:reticulon-like protein B21 [Cornus florida]|uniref:reticulon-like protein B21 n=1 Tax=Cornus florida TaxID=4283 RepID=UPI0028990129|nr:reticulon-like protein B21 [Cornus florida]
MDVGRRKGATRNGVVAGSVWESRMKVDEVKGGIKVFNGEDNSEENGDNTTATATALQVDNKRLRPKQSPVGVSGKRKTWKSESSENPIQIARQRSEVKKTMEEQFKELSVSADSIKKSPIQMKKTRSDVGKELSVSVDGIQRSPIQKMKTRSEEAKQLSVSVDGIQRNPIQSRNPKSESCEEVGEFGDGIKRNSIQSRKVKSESNKPPDESIDGNQRNSPQLRKVKSESNKTSDESGKKTLDSLGDGNERNSVELRKAKLKSDKVVDESNNGVDGPVEGIEKSPVVIEKNRSDENCKELDVCQEKVISSSLSNVSQVKSASPLVVNDDELDDDDDDEDWDEELEEEMDEEIETEVEKRSFDIKEINIPEQKPKQVVNEEKKFHQVQEIPKPISPIVRKQPPPVVKNTRIHPNPPKTTTPIVKNARIHHDPPKTTPNPVFHSIPETHNRLQNLVDLVMWRDVSRSAFVFGIGTFITISLSYTKDLNISLITVISYLGLVYLALIFLYRSILCRGVIDVDDRIQDYVVGEEEAVWLLELVLPYLNEFLLKLRALFSGDPATTMKLAVLLFVLARCGSSITIWKMAKLGFFGVFTVPKICSSYSTQLTAFGTFWVRRFQDAWESCSHKKAVAFAIFTVVWNLSSVVARIWAVFMLFVAFRCYQQSLMRDDWMEEEEEEAGYDEDSWQQQIRGEGQGRRGPTIVEIKKTKKGF